jgi:hypothetical protein
MKTCGPCGMCCKLMHIPALQKPRHSWCPHYAKGRGCGVYATRPAECAAFKCLYLQADELPEAWRPDKARFMVWTGYEARRLIVEVDPAHPAAWKQAPYYAQIKAWSDRNVAEPLEVTVRVGERVTVVFPEADIDLGVDQGRPISSGYESVGGVERPYARFVV